jgi:hypothetical protein
LVVAFWAVGCTVLLLLFSLRCGEKVMGCGTRTGKLRGLQVVLAVQRRTASCGLAVVEVAAAAVWLVVFFFFFFNR